MQHSICPSCKTEKDISQQRGLLAVEKLWYLHRLKIDPNPKSPAHPQPDGMRRLAAQNTQWFWACDHCLAEGRALPSDPTKHNIAMGTSYAAYIDRPFTCETCQCPSVFSAAEQQYWYETLGFLIWVYPKHCRSCRKQKRAYTKLQKDLMKALQNLDHNNQEQLQHIAALYAEMGLESKSSLYMRRAQNAEKKAKGNK